MKSTENFDFNLDLTEQLTEVSATIRIVWDSIRGAFHMLRSAVMRLHLNVGGTEFQAK